MTAPRLSLDNGNSNTSNTYYYDNDDNDDDDDDQMSIHSHDSLWQVSAHNEDDLWNTAVVYDSVRCPAQCGCTLPLHRLVQVLPCTDCPKCHQHALVLVQDVKVVTHKDRVVSFSYSRLVFQLSVPSPPNDIPWWMYLPPWSDMLQAKEMQGTAQARIAHVLDMDLHHGLKVGTK
jgi:hypothetical protein